MKIILKKEDVKQFTYHFVRELCSKLAAIYCRIAGFPLGNVVLFQFGPFSAGIPLSEAARVALFGAQIWTLSRNSFGIVRSAGNDFPICRIQSN